MADLPKSGHKKPENVRNVRKMLELMEKNVRGGSVIAIPGKPWE